MMSVEFRNNLIADALARRIDNTQVLVDTGHAPEWVDELIKYFQKNIDVRAFNQLYLRFVTALPINADLSCINKCTYLVIVLNHVLTSLSMLNQNDKHVKESTLITKEVIEALKRNAGEKEMEALRKRADASAYTNANANAYTNAAANAAYAIANAAYATYATAATAATYAANAANAYTYATANATATATAHATYAATYVTDWSKTKMEALEYYFSSLISLVERSA
jgi:hypothetical protein